MARDFIPVNRVGIIPVSKLTKHLRLIMKRCCKGP